MCGLAGVIFGNKRRRAEEREYLAWLFTRLLLLSEERGPHATGAAWLDIDGCHRLFKRPVPAERFVMDKAFAELLAGINNRATLLLGHTRWRTRGDERVNSNNHPIRAGEVIGTHNGTIYNADYLFRRWKMRRFAEVDSEILFRLAANAARDGARTAALHGGTDARARAKIIAAMSAAGMTIGDGNITISPSADPPTTPGTTVTVTVSVAYKGNVELMRFPLLPVPEKLSASVSMAKEGP